MIILKILLYILLAVIGLILLILVIPAGGEVSFIDGKLKYKVNLWILNVMDSEGGGILGWLKRLRSRKKSGSSSKPKKPKKPKKSKKPKKPKKPDNHDKPDKSSKTVDDAIAECTSVAVSSSDSVSDNSPDSPDTNTGTSMTDDGSAFFKDGEDDLNHYELDDTDDILDEDTEEESGHKKKKKDKKKNKHKDNDDDDENDDNDEKKPLSDKIEKLLDIWGSAKNPLCVIFKAFKFSDLYIDFVIANEDAHKCALNYGKFSALTYRGLALMSRVFTVRLKTVDIQPGFGMKKGRFDAAVKLRLRVGTIVIAGLWFLITYIFRVFIPGKLKRRKSKKSAAVQK